MNKINNINIIEFENNFPDDKYINFIIENYNTVETFKLIYTKKHFEYYFNMTKYYYCLFLENETTNEVLASITVIYDKSSKSYYVNFACVKKELRNRGIMAKIFHSILLKFNGTPITYITSKKINVPDINYNSIIKFYDIKNIKNISYEKCVSRDTPRHTPFPHQESKFHFIIKVEDLIIKLYEITCLIDTKYIKLYYLFESNKLITQTDINRIFENNKYINMLKVYDKLLSKNFILSDLTYDTFYYYSFPFINNIEKNLFIF